MKEDLLKKIPSITELLALPAVADWLARHPRKLVTDCLRQAVDELRRQVLSDSAGRCGTMHVSADYILQQASDILAGRTAYHLRSAINATGVLLHTGLGRAVLPACVVDSMVEEMKGYVTLAVDRESGERSERDFRIEYILQELTGAEAATIVNNNAAATLLVLSALAAGKETVVSRGQLIEIGGSFRLPDVMAASGTKMVEVGATNRTHPHDYERAITDNTAALLRVHPSNFRVVGFAAEVATAELARLAHSRGLICIDDLGAGALVNLEEFGLPHEPTVSESIAAGADVVLFSADKLIGAAQGGIIVGSKACIDKIRRHPLARATRTDKTCLMAIERTLHLFRDTRLLAREHPLYRMLSTSQEALRDRADKLAAAIAAAAPAASVPVDAGVGYLGSGSLPMHERPTFVVKLAPGSVKAGEIARRLRMDPHAVFVRLEGDAVIFDARTLTDAQLPAVAQAVGRAMQS